jgi:hypothetical protein
VVALSLANCRVWIVEGSGESSDLRIRLSSDIISGAGGRGRGFRHFADISNIYFDFGGDIITSDPRKLLISLKLWKSCEFKAAAK